MHVDDEAVLWSASAAAGGATAAAARLQLERGRPVRAGALPPAGAGDRVAARPLDTGLRPCVVPAARGGCRPGARGGRLRRPTPSSTGSTARRPTQGPSACSASRRAARWPSSCCGGPRPVRVRGEPRRVRHCPATATATIGCRSSRRLCSGAVAPPTSVIPTSSVARTQAWLPKHADPRPAHLRGPRALGVRSGARRRRRRSSGPGSLRRPDRGVDRRARSWRCASRMSPVGSAPTRARPLLPPAAAGARRVLHRARRPGSSRRARPPGSPAPARATAGGATSSALISAVVSGSVIAARESGVRDAELRGDRRCAGADLAAQHLQPLGRVGQQCVSSSRVTTPSRKSSGAASSRIRASSRRSRVSSTGTGSPSHRSPSRDTAAAAVLVARLWEGRDRPLAERGRGDAEAPLCRRGEPREVAARLGGPQARPAPRGRAASSRTTSSSTCSPATWMSRSCAFPWRRRGCTRSRSGRRPPWRCSRRTTRSPTRRR